ncbi:MAG: hypothetical protein KA714_10740 [Limnoraphis sp. WC205]|jgi:hypothetical protein|nr:hypothetical protein [Limnoraphis sp. WC205]
MGKRFGRIQYLLDVAGDKVKDAEIVKQYAAFKLGKKYATATGNTGNYKYKVNGQKRGSSFPGSLNAFGHPNDTEAVLVKLSGRCGASLGQAATGAPTGTASVTGVSAAALNLTIGAKADGVKLGGFSPAKMVVFVGKTDTVEKKTSGITGLPYNPKGGDSYTFPFGKKKSDAKKDNEVMMRGFLISQCNKGNQSISFKDEKV